MKLLVTSDWHLDAVTAGYPRFSDVREAAEQTVKKAIEERVDLYLFLGDLCDPDANRAPRCVAFAIEVALQLWNERIPSRWLTGNHDVIEDGSGSSTLDPLAAVAERLGGWTARWEPAIEVISEGSVSSFAGFEFLWLPYVPRAKGYRPSDLITQLATEPDGESPLIVAGHLSVAGVIPGEESGELAKGRDLVLPVDEIRSRWPNALILNGHYHRAQTDPRGVVIPGALERLTFGEERNEPRFLIIEVDHADG